MPRVARQVAGIAWAAVSLAGVSLAASARVASACVLEPTLLHHSDATLARSDTAAPLAPVVVAASAYRRSGLTCGQDVCVANNCGDLGGMAIDLEAGQDDQTPANRLGYRIELVAGVLPEELKPLIGLDLAGPAPLRLHLDFDAVPSVDATLRLIAVDAAGNESAPSAPFQIGFDGCTLAAVGDQCEGDYDADAEFAATQGSAALDTANGIDLQGATAIPLEPQPPSGQGGCSLRPGAVTRSPFAALLVLLGLGALRSSRTQPQRRPPVSWHRFDTRCHSGRARTAPRPGRCQKT